MGSKKLSATYLCRFCGKPTKSPTGRPKLYCSPSHKQQFYNLLRVQRFNSTTPEEFIKEQLSKPINPIVGNQRSFLTKKMAYTKVYRRLFNLMCPGDIFMIRVSLYSQLNSLVERLHKDIVFLKIDYISITKRTHAGNYYLVLSRDDVKR